MTRLLIPLITLGCFCAIASYSYGRYAPTPYPDQSGGYSKAERDGLSRLIKTSHGKTVYVWRTHKAATIAEVWNLTPESLESNVDIFGRMK